ncbi:MAG: S-layer homology domain-containing protein [Oscillospiraceae bacterium]
MKKRFLSLALCLLLAISVLFTPAFAVNQVKSFSDVPSDHWAHDAIMDMVSRGMFQGTTDPDANGVGTFDPDATMTRAQFIAVITRYLYADELAAMETIPDATWYLNSYQVAVDKGLIKTNKFGLASMNDDMKREEMAIVLVRAMEAMGEDTASSVQNSDIPDYNAIGTACRSYVKIAYGKGLLTGVDSQGTFDPKGTLTRAQGATVIYRLLEPSTRVEFHPYKVQEGTIVAPTGFSWVEGELHGHKPQPGDTVIKADGTEVVLQIGPGGVLGAGQGVNIWAGMVSEGKTAYGLLYDDDKDGSVFVYDDTTGEMHSHVQWKKIRTATFPGKDVIGTDGQIMNTFWRWSDVFAEWVWIGG